MSTRHLSSSDDGERGRALKRLQAAIAERNHSNQDRKAMSAGDEASGAAATGADKPASPPKRRFKPA